MQGDDFFWHLLEILSSLDRCAGSGSGKIEEGFAARNRFENYNWQNEIIKW